MSHTQQRYLSNMNRLIIFILSLSGLLMDGFQTADILCSIAVIIWLWLPYCIEIEANIINRFKTSQ